MPQPAQRSRRRRGAAQQAAGAKPDDAPQAAAEDAPLEPEAPPAEEPSPDKAPPTDEEKRRMLRGAAMQLGFIDPTDAITDAQEQGMDAITDWPSALGWCEDLLDDKPYLRDPAKANSTAPGVDFAPAARGPQGAMEDAVPSRPPTGPEEPDQARWVELQQTLRGLFPEVNLAPETVLVVIPVNNAMLASAASGLAAGRVRLARRTDPPGTLLYDMQLGN